MNSYQIGRKRWATMSIFEQMGNIYAEVGRTVKAKQIGDQAVFRAAFARALDLFDATTEVLAAEKSPKGREVQRAREQFVGLFFGSGVDEKSLENYFMHFAVAARLHR